MFATFLLRSRDVYNGSEKEWSLARSDAKQRPDNAGEQYVIFARTVAGNA